MINIFESHFIRDLTEYPIDDNEDEDEQPSEVQKFEYNPKIGQLLQEDEDIIDFKNVERLNDSSFRPSFLNISEFMKSASDMEKPSWDIT